MRSETFIPLKQFLDWMGIEGWRAAGFDILDRQGNPSIYNNQVAKDGDSCICIEQHAWQAKSHWSRDELEEILAHAEQIFIEETGLYPGPYYIEGERHQYSKGNLYKPFFPCGEKLLLGKASLTFFDFAEVLMYSGEDLLNDFLVVVEFPAGMDRSKFRFHFKPDDCMEDCDEKDFNARGCEIRPISCIEYTESGDTWTATFSAPAYMFKKPELDEVQNCRDHEEDSYVDEIAIYYEELDECEQGSVVCINPNCKRDCTEEEYQVCFSNKLIYKQDFLQVNYRKCRLDNDGIIILDTEGIPFRDTYCLNCSPTEVKMNYVTGLALTKDRKVRADVAEIIFLLAIGLAPCIKNWCECDVCSTRKIEWYRNPDNYLANEKRLNKDYDRDFDLLVSRRGIQLADGLPLNRAIVLALRKIEKMKCNRGGSYL